MSKRSEEKIPDYYELDGSEALGSYLRIKPISDYAPELSSCSIQWFRVSPEGGKRELIAGIQTRNLVATRILLHINYNRTDTATYLSYILPIDAIIMFGTVCDTVDGEDTK